jgi:hypothetical protein
MITRSAIELMGGSGEVKYSLVSDQTSESVKSSA